MATMPIEQVTLSKSAAQRRIDKLNRRIHQLDKGEIVPALDAAEAQLKQMRQENAELRAEKDQLERTLVRSMGVISKLQEVTSRLRRQKHAGR